jgi:hypothetical protein
MKTSLRSVAAAAAVIALAVAFAPNAAARPAWDTTRVTVDREVRPPKVVDARVATHPNFDRVVVDLRGQLPGYDIRYVRHLRYDGTGNIVALNGRRFLAVLVRPANAHDASGASVYAGPELQQYSFPVLRGIAFTGDFEGQVSLGIALRKKADFRVTVLRQPQRIVIDLHR